MREPDRLRLVAAAGRKLNQRDGIGVVIGRGLGIWVQQRDQAEKKVEAVQASAKIPSAEQVTPAAQKKLDIKSHITRMEQDAINNDPAAAAAKSRIVDLNAQVQTMRKQGG